MTEFAPAPVAVFFKVAVRSAIRTALLAPRSPILKNCGAASYFFLIYIRKNPWQIGYMLGLINVNIIEKI